MLNTSSHINSSPYSRAIVIINHHRSPALTTLAVDDDTAVAVNGLTADRRAVSGGEEDDARSDLAGLGRASHRTCERLLRLICHGRWNEGCPDRTGCYGVDTDTL